MEEAKSKKKRRAKRPPLNVVGQLVMPRGIHPWERDLLAVLVEAVDGSMLPEREDDNEETIRSRLDVYRQQTEPVIEYYRARGKLKTIDAEGTIDEIYERLKQAL